MRVNVLCFTLTSRSKAFKNLLSKCELIQTFFSHESMPNTSLTKVKAKYNLQLKTHTFPKIT